MHFAATLSVAGIALFLVFVAEPAFRSAPDGARAAARLRPRLTAIAYGSLILAVVSGAAWLVFTAQAMSQQSLPDMLAQGTLWTVLWQTTFGNDWLVRTVLACLLAVLFASPFAAARIESRGIKSVLAIAAAAFAGSLAWAGHAAGGLGAEAVVHPLADVLHLIAAAAWIGALLPLALLLRSAGADGALAAARTATLRFSILGMVSVATLLITGIVNSWYLVGSITALTGTDYGRLLIAKVALFGVMVAIAAVNRLWLTPHIVDVAEPGVAVRALRQLSRNAAVETVAGVVILVIVAVLGTLPPASHGGHHATYGAPPADATFVHIHTEKGMADVMIEPGRIGTAQATIHLWDDNFEQLDARRVTLTLTAPTSGSKPVTRSASENAEGAWQVGGIDLTEPGIWDVTVDAALGGKNHLVLEAPIVIEANR